MSETNPPIDPRQAARLEKAQHRAYKHLVRQVARYNDGATGRHNDWQVRLAELAAQVSMTQDDQSADSSLVLHSGEKVFLSIPGNLIEYRAGAPEYVGGHSGFSVPVASIGGRSIRYNFGRSRGHVVRSAPAPTAIDSGRLVITNQRFIYFGSQQNRECDLKKVISVDHPFLNRITVAVSNRKTPFTVEYDSGSANEVRAAAFLATSSAEGTMAAAVAAIQNRYDECLTQEPKLLETPDLPKAIAENFVIPELGDANRPFSDYEGRRFGHEQDESSSASAHEAVTKHEDSDASSSLTGFAIPPTVRPKVAPVKISSGKALFWAWFAFCLAGVPFLNLIVLALAYGARRSTYDWNLATRKRRGWITGLLIAALAVSASMYIALALPTPPATTPSISPS